MQQPQLQKPAWQYELCLNMALLDKKEAITSWEKWKSMTDINEVVFTWYQILPPMYNNLAKQPIIDDPLLTKLKGVYRYTLFKNQVLFTRLPLILREFQAAGIRTCLFRETLLATHYYPNYGLRMLNGGDLFIPKHQVQQALDVLSLAGWRLTYPATQEPFSMEQLIEEYPSCTVTDAENQEMTLRWKMSYPKYPNQGVSDLWRDEGDEDFWQRCEPLLWHGIPVYALTPTELLFEVCIQGMIISSSIVWVIDAATILHRSAIAINKDQLIKRAQSFNLAEPLQDALDYIQQFTNFS